MKGRYNRVLWLLKQLFYVGGDRGFLVALASNACWERAGAALHAWHQVHLH